MFRDFKGCIAWTDAMKPYANIGYYVPHERNFIGSHCLTILTFGGTSIVEKKLNSVEVFVNNLLDGKGTPISAFEAKQPSWI